MNWGIIKSTVAGCLTVVLVVTAVLVGISVQNYGGSGFGNSELSTFSSFKEIQEYLNTDHSVDNDGDASENFLLVPRDSDADMAAEPTVKLSAGKSDDYSTTNVQVQGVDEGDIVKNDGEYAYVVSNDNKKVHIIDVFPPKNAKLVSTIETNLTIEEIYLNGNKLLILGIDRVSYTKTCVQIYNIKVKSNPSGQRSQPTEKI